MRIDTMFDPLQLPNSTPLYLLLEVGLFHYHPDGRVASCSEELVTNAATHSTDWHAGPARVSTITHDGGVQSCSEAMYVHMTGIHKLLCVI